MTQPMTVSNVLLALMEHSRISDHMGDMWNGLEDVAKRVFPTLPLNWNEMAPEAFDKWAQSVSASGMNAPLVSGPWSSQESVEVSADEQRAAVNWFPNAENVPTDPVERAKWKRGWDAAWAVAHPEIKKAQTVDAQLAEAYSKLRGAAQKAYNDLFARLHRPHTASYFKPYGPHDRDGFCKACADDYSAGMEVSRELERAGCNPGDWLDPTETLRLARNAVWRRLPESPQGQPRSAWTLRADDLEPAVGVLMWFHPDGWRVWDGERWGNGHGEHLAGAMGEVERLMGVPYAIRPDLKGTMPDRLPHVLVPLTARNVVLALLRSSQCAFNVGDVVGDLEFFAKLLRIELPPNWGELPLAVLSEWSRTISDGGGTPEIEYANDNDPSTSRGRPSGFGRILGM